MSVVLLLFLIAWYQLCIENYLKTWVQIDSWNKSNNKAIIIHYIQWKKKNVNNTCSNISSKHMFIHLMCSNDLTLFSWCIFCFRIIPTYTDDDNNNGSALFWILDLVEYMMYFITIFLVKRVIKLLYLMWIL